MALYTVSDLRTKIEDFGTSLLFPGAGQVTLGTTNPFTGSFYISFWTLWRGINGNFHTIIAKRDSYASNGLVFSMAINTSGVLTMDTVTSFVIWGYTFPYAKWTNALWVHDTATNTDKLYINGILYSSQGIATLGTKTNALISIGSNQATPQDFFYGNLGKFVIGSGAPTAAQALTMYTQSSYTGTVWGHYKFNEGSGTTAINTEGAGPNGVISGASYSTDVARKPRATAGARTLVNRRVI